MLSFRGIIKDAQEELVHTMARLLGSFLNNHVQTLDRKSDWTNHDG